MVLFIKEKNIQAGLYSLLFLSLASYVGGGYFMLKDIHDWLYFAFSIFMAIGALTAYLTVISLNSCGENGLEPNYRRDG